MCSAYWTLKTPDLVLPCGHTEVELQTHFGGYVGSCVNYYAIDEPVDELEGLTGTLGEQASDDLFIANCFKHDNVRFFDYDAEIVDGRVVRVWPVIAGGN